MHCMRRRRRRRLLSMSSVGENSLLKRLLLKHVFDMFFSFYFDHAPAR